MRGMILAAGRGTRMGELTVQTPKPLLKINNRYLIEYSLAALTKINIKEIVINISYHAELIKGVLGNGSQYGVDIIYSEEPEALETGGGILKALPLLGSDPFIVLSADIITDYPLQRLCSQFSKLGHLILVDNPHYHPQGDFSLIENNIAFPSGKTFTFGNIGIYHPELFLKYKPGKFRLSTVFTDAITNQGLTGEYYQGFWHNIGSPEDLMQVNQMENSCIMSGCAQASFPRRRESIDGFPPSRE